LKFLLVMGSVDNVTLSWSVSNNFSLSTEFKAEEFGDVYGGTTEIVSDVQDVRNDSFDTITFSFDLELEYHNRDIVPWLE